MKLTRRSFLSLFGALSGTFCLAACSSNRGEDKKNDETSQHNADTNEHKDASSSGVIRVGALKGPTAMGMVGLMEHAKKGALDGNEYNFNLYGAPDEIVPQLVKSELDIAAVPANLASVIYHKTQGAIKVITINTLGVLYICSQSQRVHRMEDLSGLTIYAAGKGASPEHVLNYLLKAYGISATIEWKSEHAECVAALAQNEQAVALLPEPFVETAMMKNDKIHIALDLTKEWNKAKRFTRDEKLKKSQLITGVTVARTEFIDKNPEALEHFLDHYADSVHFVRSDLEQAARLMEDFDIVKAPVAKRAIPKTKIVFIRGYYRVKKLLEGYLAVLAEQDPKSVGGSLPDDSFYYKSPHHDNHEKHDDHDDYDDNDDVDLNDSYDDDARDEK